MNFRDNVEGNLQIKPYPPKFLKMYNTAMEGSKTRVQKLGRVLDVMDSSEGEMKSVGFHFDRANCSYKNMIARTARE
mgnify:CR=1 FL=1